MATEPGSTLQTPDLTMAQLVAYGATAAAIVGSLAVDVSSTWRFVGILVLVAVLVLSHVVSDAVIRNGRARALASAPQIVVENAPSPVPPATVAAPAPVSRRHA
jgi:hypothetical protein